MGLCPVLARVAFASACVTSTLDVGAVVLTVGSDGGCSHTSLQTAINALPTGGFHEIRIAASQLTSQAVQISGRGLAVRGGYASCAAATGTGFTTLNGQGGSQDSVVTIRGTGNDVLLERVNLIRGDEVYNGYGGGLDFKGAGYVTLRDTAVSQNYAGYGGGISVIAENGYAELRLESGSVIQLNTAQFSGGGVRLEGNARLVMIEPNSTITGNEALGFNPTNGQPQYGFGGGLQVIAPAIADIGSSGIGNGVIVGNTARYGGGIAINATDSDDDARVNLFTTDRARPVRIHGNRATNTGGGVYAGAAKAWPIGGLPYASRGWLCALDTRIDNNVASEGSAIYLDTDDFLTDYLGGRAYVNAEIFCPSQPSRVRCLPGDRCSTVAGNRAENASGQATAGAAIVVQNNGYFDANQVEITGNTGGYVLRAFDDTWVFIESSLVADNTVSGEVVRVEDDDNRVGIRDSTFAGNVIGAARILSINADLDIARSIFWQPGKTTLVHSGNKTVTSTIASEAGSLGGFPGAVVAFPRFVDYDRGDYRLRAASPAIDYVAQTGTNPWDVAGFTRGARLAIVPRAVGLVRDIGAYERQSVLPLVLNGDFDTDLRLWNPVSSGVSSWDPAFNASGASGSGSIKVTQTNVALGQVVNALTQCVHVPGPGVYALNGWGRGTGSMVVAGDYAQLHWDFRRTGGEGCTAGGASTSGDLILSNQATWRRPPNPALITVSAANWTSTSSIAVTLVVVENSLTTPRTANGWFDGITLEPLLDDTIFRNGFDP